MRKQLWMLIVLALALLISCTEATEDSDNSNNENNQSTESSTSYTVHFCTNSIADWGSVYVYAWSGSSSNAEWPGELMTKESSGWYGATVNYSNVIFNDGSSNQTGDLTAQDGYFLPESKSAGKVSGTWYTSKPSNTTVGGGSNNDKEEEPEPDYPDEPEPDYPDEPAYLSAPTLTSASYSETTGKISLSWSSVSNCSYYEIYYSTTGNDKKYLDYTTSTSASVTKSKEGVTYYFWIKAVGSSTSSAYSNYKTVYVPASWTPPTVYNEIEGTGTSNAIYANVTAGETYWFRFYASQPSNPYTYTISFFDMDSGDSAFTGDVVGDFYNQTGNIFASSVDNGTFGPSCSYIVSQYIYIKIQCVSSGSFAIYVDKSR